MKNEISRRAFALCVCLFPMVFKSAMLPMLLAGEVGRDAYLGIALLLIPDLIELLIIYRVINEGGLSRVFERNSKIVKYIVSASIIVAIGVKSTVYLAEVVNYISSYLFYNVGDKVIYALMALGIGFVAVRGGSGMGKMWEIAVWIIPVILVPGFIFGDVSLDLKGILPAVAEGGSALFKGSFKYVFWSMDFLPLIVLKPRGKPTKLPWHLVGFGVMAAAMVFIYMAFIASYGGSAHLIRYAFATLSAFNVVTSEIGSLEWTGSALWLAMSVVYLALSTYAIGECLGFLGVKQTIGAVISAAIGGFIGIIFMGDYQKVLVFATCGVQYALAALELGLPLVCLLLLRHRGYRFWKNKEAGLEKVG